MTAFVPTQLGVLLPSDINELTANGIADGEFAKRVGGAWDGVKAVQNALYNPLPQYQKIFARSLSLQNGDNTIDLTVPTGYKAITGFQRLLCQSGSAATVRLFLVRDGTTYYVNGALINNNASSLNPTPFVVLAGDIFKINVTSSPVRYSEMFVLIPDNSEIKPLSIPIGIGNTIIYTCPTGKVAIVSPIGLYSVQQQWGFFGNNSGTSRSFSLHLVADGDTPSASNALSSAVSYGNQIVASFVANGPVILTSGESLVGVSDGSGAQLYTGLIVEQDA